MMGFEHGSAWKPWYVWRPRQLGVRIWRECRPRPAGYQPIVSAWGSPIVVDPATTIGHSLWTTGIHDIAVSEVLARLTNPGDLVIDAGAHVGYMTALAAVAAGPEGRVLAFEPHPMLFSKLQQTITLTSSCFPVGTVTAKPSALGESKAAGTLTLTTGFASNDGIARIAPASGSEPTIPITVETIDMTLGSERASVLKLDVEGHEIHVLRGGRGALTEHRLQHVIFEDFASGSSEVMSLLESFGYRVYAIGWTVRGPQLRLASEGRLAKTYEAPNYVATLDPETLLERCRPAGWRVLRPRLGLA